MKGIIGQQQRNVPAKTVKMLTLVNSHMKFKQHGGKCSWVISITLPNPSNKCEKAQNTEASYKYSSDLASLLFYKKVVQYLISQ